MSAAQSLWPQDEAAPRRRPLRFHEEPQPGQRVWVHHDVIHYAREFRFHSWMQCGRVRYALLASGGTEELFVCAEERVRVQG